MAFGYSLRSLRRNPVFVIVAVLTLGLGIGVNTAIFSSVNAMLFRPMPVQYANRLVVLAVQDKEAEFAHGLSYLDFLDYRGLKNVFDDAVAFTTTVANFHHGSVTDRLWLEAVTGNYFPMLGLNPALGRLFGPAEERSSALVLSYACWKDRFGSDSSIVGSSVRLNGHDFVIVGVAPESYHGGVSYMDTEGFVPLKAAGLGMDTDHRDRHGYRVLARLKQGVSVEKARAAAVVLASSLEKQYPASNRDVHVVAMLETDSRPEPQFEKSVPRLAASGMVLVAMLLLIACANIANLLLARASGRTRELAIRAALGASRFQLIQLLLSESLVLAVLGMSAGLLLATWITGYFASIRPSVGFHFRMDYSFDWRVLLFTVSVTLLTSAVCGLFPALQIASWDLNPMLKQASGPFGSAKRRLSSVLVVAQVAISLLLLICASLFVRGMQRAGQVDLGYQLPDREIFSFNLAHQDYDAAKSRVFIQRLVERVQQLPQVKDAAFTRFLPFGGFSSAQIYKHDELPSAEKSGQSAMWNVIGPSYFRTMGTGVLQGREFSGHDDATSKPVAIVNQALANRLWPNQTVLGQRLRVGAGEEREVVGVVRTGKYFSLTEEPRPWFYLPLAQQNANWGALVVHSGGPSAVVFAEVREEFRKLDPELPVFEVMTLDHLVKAGYIFGPLNQGAQAAAAFGIVGLLLAAIGIYGVISYSATERTREIAIRIGLGAGRRDVLAMIMRQGMVLIGSGVAIGLSAALALGSLLRKVIFGISPNDPVTLAAVTGALVLVGLLACYLPSRRAASVDPMVALRFD